MKKVQYSIGLMQNPLHENDPKKAYANLQLTGIVGTRELAQHIIEHGSTFSRGTIEGIISDLGVCVREFILQGYKVLLGTIGSLEPEIKSLGALTVADFTEENIVDYYVNFRPSNDLLNLRSDVQLEQTTTRAAQRAALKAQKAGLTSADWSEQDNDDSDDDGEGSGNGNASGNDEP